VDKSIPNSERIQDANGGLPFNVRFLAALRDSGKLSKLGAPAMRLLLAHLAYANTDGEAWPGNKRLQNDTGLSERAVRRSRSELVGAGCAMILDGVGGRARSVRVRLLIVDSETRTNSSRLSHETRTNIDRVYQETRPKNSGVYDENPATF
jgi:hypothetical protein